MGVEIRLPNITGKTEREQLLQLKSYLYQLSEQLQWAFDNISTTGQGSGYVVNQVSRANASGSLSNRDAAATFSAIKSLIIKSADIVDAYYEEINKRLEGLYVSQSDFGAFAEKTALDIKANSTAITQTFESTQIIIRETKSEIDGSLQNIGEDLSFAQKDIITIKGNVEDIGGNISDIEADIGDLDTSIKNAKIELGGSIDAAKNELSSNIDSTREELSESINNNVDAARAEASADIAEAKSELGSEIGATKNELDGKIIDANGRIDETNDAVENLGTGLDDANKRIDSAEGALQEAKDELNGAIQGVAASLSNTEKLLESAKAQLKGSIDDLEFDLAGLMQIVIGVTAYIKSGLLYYTDAGVPVYGIEIGQEVESNGEKVFNKFSRFTSEKLSFYDSNGNEVAYISDKKLYIGQAEITISLKVGSFIDLVMANGDVVTKWEGGNG